MTKGWTICYTYSMKGGKRMTYDEVKKIKIPLGQDVAIFEVITNTGNSYLVASKSVDGAKKKVVRYEGKNLTFISIIEKERGIL